MERIALLSAQLDRTLGFFGRVDSKASFVFASNIGVLAITFYNLDYRDLSSWYVAVPLVITIALIGFSLFDLYSASYPRLGGGEDSHFYFKSVAGRTEAAYISSFCALKEKGIEEELLGQIWRNSQILRDKFTHVEKAFRFTLISALPWFIFLVASSVIHSRAIIVK